MKFLLCSRVNLIQIRVINSLLEFQGQRVCFWFAVLVVLKKKQLLICHLLEICLTLFVIFFISLSKTGI